MGKYSIKQLFIFAAVVYLIAVIFSVGNHHPDEHFQIFEFAAYKLGLSNATDLPWEFHFRMRPTLQPAMVVVVHRFFGIFGLDNPFFIAFFFRLMSAALSIFSIWLLVELYINNFKHSIVKYWYVVLSLFIWISVYNNVRFSSENLSGSLFVIGFAWVLRKSKPSNWTYLAAGALFGLSFVIRYQAAFMVLGFGLWLLIQRKDAFKKLVLLTLAFFALVGVGVLVDRWFYGEWVISTWNYLKHNILEDRVSGFGVESWFFYITQIFMDLVPPFSLIYIVPLFWMIYRKPKSALVWTVVPFLLIHFVIGHKETRFLYPIIGFLPVAIAYYVDWMLKEDGADLFEKSRGWYWFKKLFWISNVVLLIAISVLPANNMVVQHKKVYDSITGPSVMYYGHYSPYGAGLEFKYYMRPDIEKVPYDIMDTIVPIPGKQVFIGTEDYAVYSKYKDKGRLIYQSYPYWFRNFNINGWVDRTTWYYILEITGDEAQK